MLNVVIVDDEPLALEGLSNYVREVDFLSLVGTGENPIELMNILGATMVDLVFLDIQMPKMNGIDYLKIAQNRPMVILTTAYPSYAIEGYRLNVLDYLLKPILFDRFIQAAHKAKDYQQLKSQQSTTAQKTPEDYFFVKCDHKYEKIFFDDILYIQGMQNYVAIFTRKGKYITHLTLKNIEANLLPHSFIRVHKSYIVSIPKISSVESQEIRVASKGIPLSRNYKEQVMDKVVKQKLFK